FFLRFASASVPSINPDPQNVSPPVVLGIGDSYYEKEFNQASPLSRRELKKIIGRIAESRPRVVAIDLDLSPGPCPETKNQGSDCTINDYTVEESELYNYLLMEKPRDVRIVLQLPFPVYDKDLRNRKLEWMNSLCEKGIEFGRVSIDSEFGMATRIRRGPDRLSCSVYRMKREQISNQDAGKICGNVRDQHAKNDSNKSQNEERANSYTGPVCKLFKNHRSPKAERLLFPLIEEPPSVESAFINFNFVRNFRFHEVMKLEDIPANLTGDVVLLGGVYGDGDRFNTPMGEIPGVMLLLGDYYSLLLPIEERHLLAVIIEILFGIAFGFAFAWGWKYYFRIYPVFQGYLDANEIGSTAFYLSTILVSLLVIAIILGIFAYWSANLMARGLWINPAPMVLGMAGEGFVAGLEAAGEKHESHCEKKPGGLVFGVFVFLMTMVFLVIVFALKIVSEH
ncbi:MAG: CHASE2 domain-containing protein, partial [Methylococcales bacterium]